MNIFPLLVFLCYKADYLKISGLKEPTFIITFGSVVWVQLRPHQGLTGSHKSEIKVFAGLYSYLEALLGMNLLPGSLRLLAEFLSL